MAQRANPVSDLEPPAPDFSCRERAGKVWHETARKVRGVFTLIFEKIAYAFGVVLTPLCEGALTLFNRCAPILQLSSGARRFLPSWPQSEKKKKSWDFV